MPLAYFLTFSTYGARLHGNAEGSVDEQNNKFGAHYVDANANRERHEFQSMKQPPYVMDASEREIVYQSILSLAAERDWVVLAAHVRSTHVHVVIQTEQRDPGRTLSDLKARASRDLARAGFGNSERRRWSRHGSTRHLFEPLNIEGAIRYTLDEQGEPMACYDPRPPEERPGP